MPLCTLLWRAVLLLLPLVLGPPVGLGLVLVLGLVLEEGVLEQLSGRRPLGGVFLKALADHLAEGAPVLLELLLVLGRGVDGGRVVLEG